MGIPIPLTLCVFYELEKWCSRVKYIQDFFSLEKSRDLIQYKNAVLSL